MLKFFVRHGMIVDKNREIVSFKQNKWLEKFIDLNTQKRNEAKYDFEKHYKRLNNAFCGKRMKIVRNRLRLEFITNYEKKENYKTKV